MSEFENILTELEQMLEEAWTLPMSGGKCVINREEFQMCIKGLHTYFPTELAKARSLLDERERILFKAKADAERLVKEADERAMSKINEKDIVVQAKKVAEDMINDAKEESTRMRKAAIDYIDSLLKRVETLYDTSLASISQARRVIQGEKE